MNFIARTIATHCIIRNSWIAYKESKLKQRTAITKKYGGYAIALYGEVQAGI